MEIETSCESDQVQSMRHQRDRAFACALLSFAIGCVMVGAQYSLQGERYLESLQRQVVDLKKVLADNKAVLVQNREALRNTQAALETLKARRQLR